MNRMMAPESRSRPLFSLMRHSGTAANATASNATMTKPIAGTRLTTYFPGRLGLCTCCAPAPRSCRGRSDGQASGAKPSGRATQQKPIRGSFRSPILIAHQRYDHAADGAHLLIVQAGTHYHGADIAHHGFALGRRKEEFGRIQFLFQMLEQPHQVLA